MKKQLLTAIGLTLLLPIFSQAQNEVDVLRYSQTTFGGTARSNSMAGAFGALGGDFSTLATNPAGIAIYRKSEISLTPSIYIAGTKSDFLGKTYSDSKLNFNFGNFGMVLNFKNSAGEEGLKWRSFTLGFGYNRLDNFNARFQMRGENNYSSLTEALAARSNGRTPFELDKFADSLAFYLFLIDTVPGSTTKYRSNFPGFYNKTQTFNANSEGGMGEFDLSFGGNFADQFYIGGTIGFPRVNYIERTRFKEEEIDSVPAFKRYTFDQAFSTTGRGVNFKLGMIYKPVEWMRIGGAVHSPTYFSLTDQFNSSMTAVYDDGSTFSADSPQGSFSYQLTTPMRAIGSLGFVIKGLGIISADYEYVDYSTGSLSARNADFFDQNDAVTTKYKAASNIRVGAEYRLKLFNLRAGYANYGSPFQKGINTGTRENYTAGIGFRQEGYFIDFAYVLSKTSSDFYVYDPAYIEAAHRKISSSSLMATVGFRF
jgi:hypothetical protein